MPLPVDPFAIAQNLGIAVKQEVLDDNLAGFIVRENGGQVEIFLNALDAHVRQRFTLAHELGHFFKNRGEENIGYVDERSELASSGTDPSEVWCNQFAAELLMPAAIVKKYWAEGMSLDDLRNKFRVSTAAIEYRLKNLGLV
ncbi:ImmA/IrrE family metallo-endopeptidase [Mycobacterium sp. 1164985.4]|uniref:ImmA/IrrE family metallo-endopeptidase n=1 Tax=Mycobacterium sp. 1164985.4 TaxID=1834069 RepID=UPI000A881DB1|nr:ImmA/IrrE family metallo-endopeptidase [Mycobacterium sp. 1164985.4]